MAASSAQVATRRGVQELLMRQEVGPTGKPVTVVVSAPPLVEIALRTIRSSAHVVVADDGTVEIAHQVRYHVLGVGRPGTLLCRRVYRTGDRA